MQLQTQRNLEYFLKLIGIEQPEIEDVMTFQFATHQLYLEVRLSRVFITVCCQVDTPLEALATLLPYASEGPFRDYIARLFCLDNSVAINCVTPDNYCAEAWMAIYHSQCRLLARCKRHGR